MIAMAVASTPRVLVADEPTTALGRQVQSQVMQVLAQARAQADAALVLITHDLGLVAEVADRVAIMYSGGSWSRAASSRSSSTRPTLHPRSARLAADHRDGGRPRRGAIRARRRAGDRPPGCAFAPRCPLASEAAGCTSAVPALRAVSDTQSPPVTSSTSGPLPRRTPGCPRERHPAAGAHGPGGHAEEVLRVEDLHVRFGVRDASGRKATLRAVDGVSFTIRRGETLGLVR